MPRGTTALSCFVVLDRGQGIPVQIVSEKGYVQIWAVENNFLEVARKQVDVPAFEHFPLTRKQVVF